MKNYKKEIYKTKEEWLANRGIGSSEAAAICNESKWLTANDIYSKLVLGKQPVVAENERMREGTLAEEHIRALFGLDHPQFQVKNPPKTHWCYKRLDYPLITCTPDGILIDKTTKEKFGLEIKDVELRRKDTIDMWMNNVLPSQYYYQCLQYMVVIQDLKGVCLDAHLKHFKFDPNKNDWVFDYAEDKPYWIYREDVVEHIDYLFNKEKDFIDNNVKKHIRPKLVFKI